MQIENHETLERSQSWTWYGILGFLFLAGFALASVGGALHHVQAGTAQLLGNISVKSLLLATIGITCAFLLIRHAEVASERPDL